MKACYLMEKRLTSITSIESVGIIKEKNANNGGKQFKRANTSIKQEGKITSYHFTFCHSFKLTPPK